MIHFYNKYVRVTNDVIEAEMKYLGPNVDERGLYIKFYTDEDGILWFGITGHKIKDSYHVDINRPQKTKYKYFRLQYTHKTRLSNGIDLLGSFVCKKVSDVDGVRYRRVESITNF